jgi:phospholipid/cholesterol/gamma-HCH transport system substrate-binding protein
MNLRLSRATSLVVVALLVAIAIGALSMRQPTSRQLTATFSSTVSLYAGAKVKVLGVAVGRVDAVEVKGTSVQVKISYDDSVRLPRDVHAVVVPPSIVGDRFVQLTPAYTDGAELPDGASLDLSRTAVPLELDDTFRSLDDLSVALGPKGANSDGALSRLITASARNLGGNGRALNQTIRDLAGAISTLATSKEDVSGTVANLNRTTRSLAGDDDEMRALVTNLALVSTQLNGQRDDLSTAVRDLDSALRVVSTFLRTHRKLFRENINGLTSVSGALARHTDELGALVDVAPVGLVNLMNIYVPRNWDPEHPFATPVEGRVGSQAQRVPLTSDLDIQLGYTLSALCAALPAAQALQLSAFCTALHVAGGNLGKVIMQATGSGRTGLSAPVQGADTLTELLTGGLG